MSTAEAPPRIEVVNHREAERYEIRYDSEEAGFAVYRLRLGLIAFIHTEIEPRFEGRGLGGTLARHALDDARAQGLEVLPFCPFINGFIHEHREYVDLVPDANRKAFGL
ncbi:MAG: N-acetyltransferase [Solirubrobacterales bacterium]|nr:N-acetyltransferase [Solirubrobacterales bacterium]